MRLLHVLGLSEVGGIQRDFTNFVSATTDRRNVEHHVLLTRPGIAPPITDAVTSSVASIHGLRHWGRVKLPGWLPGLKQVCLKRALKISRAQVIVLWSAPRALQDVRVPSSIPVVYYEHGAVWFNRDVASIRQQVKTFSGVLCNSHASSRMVSLRWQFDDPDRLAICPNAIVMPASDGRSAARSLAPGKNLRLGVAGRLEALKGVTLAVHALKVLVDRGVSASLRIAGTGPEAGRIRDQASALGLAGHVELVGFVDDMNAFYNSIDLLLCPSLREPFGLVSAEAMARGLPVVCTAVDGLPEVVIDGQSGRCVAPSLDLSEYACFGGVMEGVPALVYDPASDEITPARLAAPADLAEAIESIVSAPETYARFSRAAVVRAAELSDYDGHVEDVLVAIERFAGMAGEQV